MKDNGKSSSPIIAANSKKNTGEKPAPPARGKNSGKKARVSRMSNGVSDKAKSLVLERISDGILAFDNEMNTIYLNERAGEILGRESQSLLGKNFREEYPQADSVPFAGACQRAVETKTVVPFGGHFPASDNWFEGKVYPSEDGVSILIREGIPSREYSADDALAKSEEKFSKAFHLNPSPMAIIRVKDRRFFDVNQSLLNLLGYQREEMIEKSFEDLGISISAEEQQTLVKIWKADGNIYDQ